MQTNTPPQPRYIHTTSAPIEVLTCQTCPIGIDKCPFGAARAWDEQGRMAIGVDFYQCKDEGRDFSKMIFPGCELPKK